MRNDRGKMAMTNSLKPSDPGRKERISRKAAKEKHFVGSASKPRPESLSEQNDYG
jgi:hypothetical protein